MHYKPYLRFHVEEIQFDGQNWLIAFTPRGITWEMRRLWKAERVPVLLQLENVKRYWKQIEGGVREYLIREYWTLDKKK